VERQIIKLSTYFCHTSYAKCGGSGYLRGWIMIEVGNVPVEVVNFREEARECVQLAKAEKHAALRTVLLGMALGYLRLDDRAKSAGAIELQAEDIRPLHG
jgi:hypothetical protein